MSTDGPVCFVTDLPRAWCDHCRPRPKAAPAVDPDEHGRIFTAEYHGTCGVCTEHIAPGDEAAYLRIGGLACNDCLGRPS